MAENKAHANEFCGAKTRSGEPCRNRPMANGRCRMHGGKSTGPSPEKMRGNKNAVRTGEYETIWLDTLDDDERELYHAVRTDVMAQLDAEIRLTEIRERRMMKRIQELKAEKLIVADVLQHTTLEDGAASGKKGQVRRENPIFRIQAIEDALTRVQERKARLLEMKYRIETEKGPEAPDITPYVEALQGIAKEVWRDAE